MTKAMTPKTETSKRKKALVPIIVLAVYSILTFLGAINHEIWLDEAQAWVILRDAPLSELPHILKVEGHPPLWYLILYPFVKLGFPADYASLISWFFMAAGALVLLFKVELPMPLKAVILASGGFLYFNSVMLRVYCLIPLLLFLILWIYPKRREHAVLYGLLVALLANTHIFISGIVGILGIFMLYELFSEWKKSPKKENIKKLAGLAIAGAGVLLLIVPLIGSLEANGASSERLTLSPSSVIFSVSLVFNNVFELIFPYFDGPLWVFVLITATLLLWGMIILLRHWRRALAVEIGFLVFYWITCEVFWISIPNRAAIFVLSFAFSLGLAEYEKPAFKTGEISGKITSPALKGLVGLLEKADKQAKKVFTCILIVFFAVSVPSGAETLYKDIVGNFSSTKETAQFISENLEEDAVFAALGCGLPELSIYAPGISIYGVGSGEFCTYDKWEYMYRPPRSVEEVVDELSQYEHLYIIHYSGQAEDADDILFIGSGMTGYDLKNSLIIRKYSDVLIENYLYSGV